MMVHRTGGKRGGNIEFEMQVTQLGKTRKERRIRRTIDTGNRADLERVRVAVRQAIKDERWSVLKAYRDGELSTADLLAGFRKGRASRTLTGIRMQRFLWDRVVATTSGDKIVPGAISRAMGRIRGKANRNRYLTSFKALQQRATKLGPDATVADLLTFDWAELAEQWGTSNTDWMHLQKALSRFATLHTGDKYGRFARKLRQLIPRKKVKKRRPTLTIEQFKAAVAQTPPHATAAYWVLAATGVRIGEYLASTAAHLDAASHTYLVPGAAKNEIGDFPLRIDPRWWSTLERGIPARLGHKWLHVYWMRACIATGLGRQIDTGKSRRVRRKLERGQNYTRRGHMEEGRPDHQVAYDTVPVMRYRGPTLHDLRHCHGQWAINAKVDESKVQGSLRHENPNQTRDYTMQAGTLDVSAALADAILDQPKKRKKA